MQYVAQQAEKRFIQYGTATLEDLGNIADNAENSDKFLILSVSMKNIRDRSLAEDSDYRIQEIIYLDRDLNPRAHSNVISLADSFHEKYQDETYRIPNQQPFAIKTLENYPFSEIYRVTRQELLEDFQDGLLTAWLGFLLRFATPTEWSLDFMSILKTAHISMPINQSPQSVFGDRIHLFMTNTGVLLDLENYADRYGSQLLAIGFWVVFILTFAVRILRSGEEGRLRGSPPSPIYGAGAGAYGAGAGASNPANSPVVTNYFPGQGQGLQHGQGMAQAGVPTGGNFSADASIPYSRWRWRRRQQHWPNYPQAAHAQTAHAPHNPYAPHPSQPYNGYPSGSVGSVVGGEREMEAHPLPYTINYFSPPVPPATNCPYVCIPPLMERIRGNRQCQQGPLILMLMPLIMLPPPTHRQAHTGMGSRHKQARHKLLPMGMGSRNHRKPTFHPEKNSLSQQQKAKNPQLQPQPQLQQIINLSGILKCIHPVMRLSLRRRSKLGEKRRHQNVPLPTQKKVHLFKLCPLREKPFRIVLDDRRRSSDLILLWKSRLEFWQAGTSLCCSCRVL